MARNRHHTQQPILPAAALYLLLFVALFAFAAPAHAHEQHAVAAIAAQHPEIAPDFKPTAPLEAQPHVGPERCPQPLAASPDLCPAEAEANWSAPTVSQDRGTPLQSQIKPPDRIDTTGLSSAPTPPPP